MSLTNLSNDLCSVNQYAYDSQQMYDFQMSSVQNYRPEPSPQGGGVIVDRLGNGQSQVDLESLLRNQGGISSNCPTFISQQEQRFNALMAQQSNTLSTVQYDLVPQIQYRNRACSDMSGISIDRFDFLPIPRMGFQYGYADIPVDTVSVFKDQIAANRAPQ